MTTNTPHSLVFLAASAVPALTVVWSVDPLTPLVVGLAIVTLVSVISPTSRFPWGRIGIVALAAATMSVTSLLYARPRGDVYLEWGVITITDGSFDVAVAAFARILAIAIPAVLVFSLIEPHQLVATTVVRRIVPQRAALAALIALRLAPVIAADLRETRVARRANGFSTGFGSLVVTTLVVAIRRAIRLAEIAEVRGFSSPHRIWTSYQPLSTRDGILVGTSFAVGVLALVTTAAAGMWNSAI